MWHMLLAFVGGTRRFLFGVIRPLHAVLWYLVCCEWGSACRVDANDSTYANASTAHANHSTHDGANGGFHGGADTTHDDTLAKPPSTHAHHGTHDGAQSSHNGASIAHYGPSGSAVVGRLGEGHVDDRLLGLLQTQLLMAGKG